MLLIDREMNRFAREGIRLLPCKYSVEAGLKVLANWSHAKMFCYIIVLASRLVKRKTGYSKYTLLGN